MRRALAKAEDDTLRAAEAAAGVQAKPCSSRARVREEEAKPAASG